MVSHRLIIRANPAEGATIVNAVEERVSYTFVGHGDGTETLWIEWVFDHKDEVEQEWHFTLDTLYSNLAIGQITEAVIFKLKKVRATRFNFARMQQTVKTWT